MKGEAHIYGLTPADKAALRKLAKRECRSMNGQIVHLIRQGLAAEPALTPEPQGITDAVRRRLSQVR